MTRIDIFVPLFVSKMRASGSFARVAERGCALPAPSELTSIVASDHAPADGGGLPFRA
jgi:hypothetical protein